MSEDGFLGLTYTKTVKVLTTAAARYLLYALPNVKVWHKAFFGRSGCRAGAHTHPAWPNIPTTPSAFPLLGAPQASGNNPPTEGGKSLRGRPPEAGVNLQLSRHTRPDPCRIQHGKPKCDPTTGEAQCYYSCCGICWPPHPTGKYGTRPFLWWVRTQDRSPHAPGISKNANGPVGIHLIRGASGAGRWTHPPRRE